MENIMQSEQDLPTKHRTISTKDNFFKARNKAMAF